MPVCKNNFDPSKIVQTRSGRPASILAINLKGSYPILATILDEEGGRDWDQMIRTTKCGSYSIAPGEYDLDLINVPEETIEFYNVYPKGFYKDDPMGSQLSRPYADGDAAAKARSGGVGAFTIAVTRRDGAVVSVELV